MSALASPPATAGDVLAGLDRSVLDEAVPLNLQVGHVRLAIRCEEPLRSDLERYFDEALTSHGPADAVLDVLEGQTLDPALEWIDWAREPGKTGRKDAYFDLADGRLVHKIRTGMTFLQSPDALVALGPCARYPNQIINFVNTQVLNICQRKGWQICHAAAVTDGETTLAIAGLSGGGKSTTILRLMEIAGVSFVTNDRLLVRGGNPLPQSLGIPKQPRINPGTILHNPRLRPMLTADRISALEAMPPQALWKLEEKHDLIVRDLYGLGRVRFEAPLSHFWVLNWSRDTDMPAAVTPVDIVERPDLLSAIMKSPGPFYRKPDGSFLTDDEPLDAPAYLEALRGVQVFEVSGRIDFDALHEVGQTLFEPCANASPP